MAYFFLLIVIGLALFALFLRWREPSMIYYPKRTLDATPAAGEFLFEDVWLTTSDSVRIHGWYVPAASTNAPVFLFFHGNAGNISHRMEKLSILHNLGASVFMIDYRGYGRSEGKPNETGTYRDAQAAYDHLTKHLNLDPKTILLYGESLGSAITVELATHVACGGVVLEEPFTSVTDIAQKMFPFLPVSYLVQNRYDSLSKINRLHAPLLIFHSYNDEMFPMSYAESLLAAAPEPKQLIRLRGSHNDAFHVSADDYRHGLLDFLAAHATQR